MVGHVVEQMYRVTSVGRLAVTIKQFSTDNDRAADDMT